MTQIYIMRSIRNCHSVRIIRGSRPQGCYVVQNVSEQETYFSMQTLIYVYDVFISGPLSIAMYAVVEDSDDVDTKRQEGTLYCCPTKPLPSQHLRQQVHLSRTQSQETFMPSH